QMDRRPEPGHADRCAFADEALELRGLEVLEASTEADVRIAGDLRLHPHQVLDEGWGVARPTRQEPLPLEQRAVQRATSEHGRGRRAIRRTRERYASREPSPRSTLPPSDPTSGADKARITPGMRWISATT